MNITLGQGIDIVFGIIIFFNIFLGLWRGAIKEVFHIVGLVLSIYLGMRFYEKVGNIFVGWGLPKEYGVPNIVGFITIFMCSWILIKIIAHIINRFVKKVGLSLENRIFGGILGFFKGGIIVFITCLIMNYILTVDFSRIPDVQKIVPKVKQSKVLALIKKNMPMIEKAIGKDSKFAKMFPSMSKSIESAKTSADDLKVTADIGAELQKNPNNFNKLLEIEEVKKLSDDPVVKEVVKGLLADKEFKTAVEKKDWNAVGAKLLPLMQNKALMDKLKSLDKKKILEELRK
ncbi:CvpA family protein [bacterium]|nr:CvpA family protein [bacterium]